MTNNEFPFRAYAMEYGTFLGAAWAIVFFIYMSCLRTNNVILQTIWLFSFLSLAVMPFLFAWRVKQLQPEGEHLGIARGLLFALNLFTFACVLAGACEFFYFNYLDNGLFTDSISQILTNPETSEIYKQAGLTDMYKQTQEVMDLLYKMTPFEKTEMFLYVNVITSMFMLIPVAIIASLTSKKHFRADMDGFKDNYQK